LAVLSASSCHGGVISPPSHTRASTTKACLRSMSKATLVLPAPDTPVSRSMLVRCVVNCSSAGCMLAHTRSYSGAACAVGVAGSSSSSMTAGLSLLDLS